MRTLSGNHRAAGIKAQIHDGAQIRASALRLNPELAYLTYDQRHPSAGNLGLRRRAHGWEPD
jgi:hypothetical protein